MNVKVGGKTKTIYVYSVSNFVGTNHLPIKKITLFAMDKKNYVGEISFSISQVYNYAILEYISVVRRYTRQGYGTALMMAMENIASSFGVGCISGLFSGDMPAKKMYDKMGYRFIKRDDGNFNVTNRCLRCFGKEVVLSDKEKKKIGIKEKSLR